MGCALYSAIWNTPLQFFESHSDVTCPVTCFPACRLSPQQPGCVFRLLHFPLGSPYVLLVFTPNQASAKA